MNDKPAPEEWRPVIGNEEKYQVSDLGRVYSERSGRFLTLKLYGSGRYYVVQLSGQRWTVSRLVATAFIPNPDNLPLVRHLNDIPTDNRVENLAWGTASDNARDAVRNGRHPLAKKTHCKEGHPLPKATRGHRICPVCRVDYDARYQQMLRDQKAALKGDPEPVEVGQKWQRDSGRDVVTVRYVTRIGAKEFIGFVPKSRGNRRFTGDFFRANFLLVPTSKDGGN